MTKTQIFIFAILIAGMIAAALALGNWSEQINPDGIMPHPAAEGETAEANAPRDAFSFGVSMGLLGTALLYCCIAFGLFIQAKSNRQPISKFTLWVAGLSVLGFALSYLIDDYFY